MAKQPQRSRAKGLPPILSITSPSGAHYVLRVRADGSLTDAARRFAEGIMRERRRQTKAHDADEQKGDVQGRTSVGD